MSKQHRPWVAVAFVVGLALAIGTPSMAQDYPVRPVKFINQGGPGSGPDVICRIVADHLSRLWGQQAVVLNHPGAGGAIAARAAAAAEPDGYTLYMPASATYTVLPESQAPLPFNLDKDFVPVGFVSEQPMVITVPPALGINTLSDLIARAKAEPGKLLYAGTVRGQLPHLAGELFKAKAGIDIVFVPYPGSSQALQDIIGGRIAVMVENLSVLSGLIKAGTLKALAVTAPERLASFPDLPTVAETVPGFAAMGWFVVMAPAGTPDAVVRKVNIDLNATLDRPDVRQRFQDMGSFVRTMKPAEVTQYIQKEQTAWRPLVRQLGLTASP
jgi:tripartite-type tricarboxylate transporter receptor subunit TctC